MHVCVCASRKEHCHFRTRVRSGVGDDECTVGGMSVVWGVMDMRVQVRMCTRVTDACVCEGAVQCDASCYLGRCRAGDGARDTARHQAILNGDRGRGLRIGGAPVPAAGTGGYWSVGGACRFASGHVPVACNVCENPTRDGRPALTEIAGSVTWGSGSQEKGGGCRRKGRQTKGPGSR